jgi:hypothetical protein
MSCGLSKIAVVLIGNATHAAVIKQAKEGEKPCRSHESVGFKRI